MSTEDKAHLARIRDNQRRSRARRKEYLQELESKYRKCEQLGVEATAEIQAAARRVAAENKQLRALLRDRGISDKELDDYLGQGPQQQQRSHQGCSTVSDLESKLNTRRACKTSDLSGRGCHPGPNPISASRERLPMLQPAQEKPALQPSNTQPYGVSPSSSCSTSTCTPSQGYASSEMMPESAESSHGYQSSEVWMDPSIFGLSDELDQNNTSSCTYAAKVIQDMGNGVTEEQVGADLGCPPGTNCKIDNSMVFNILDRYSGQPYL
ncbi:MAG: hypothetical protein M1819_005453 [Sarea resinae]|nr:MAG: hypothetical protein M1819_005453 [Sarea resinae]